jgi:hypothetical protein
MAESSLDRLLRLANASLLEPAALGKTDKSEDEPSADEVHAHLMRECPWYKNVSAEKCCSDPDEHCGICRGGGALVKFTPHTGEASTVDQPTVPPGGPGLFHVKGLHLPPYVQHLYKHLVARYGKEKAYGVAVGVVKRWAAGVNPGGKHPTKTHPDVRAAAAKNVAEWEADRAKAHAQSSKRASSEHVKAAAPQPRPIEGGAAKVLSLPPPPKKTAAMMTAHRVCDMKNSLSHAVERMDAARKTKDPALRKYHVLHVRNHLNRTIGGGHMLADNLRRNYPAEGRELDVTMQTLGLATSLSPALKAATTAHLLETVLNECTHSIRHGDLLSRTDPPNEWEFNADHCQKHLGSALEHAVKLSDHIRDNYPAEAKFLAGLGNLSSGEDAYVKAAAQQFSYGQFRQEPSQTVSPSPPLPLKVDLPLPKELRSFAGDIRKMADDQDHHLVAAQMHLESAAEKMPNNPVSALHSLRSCQMAIQQAWRERVMHAQPRIAYVFSVNTPPAEQSSQRQIYAQEQDRIGEMKAAMSRIAVFIDQVRRSYFGRRVTGMGNDGGISGQPNARM